MYFSIWTELLRAEGVRVEHHRWENLEPKEFGGHVIVRVYVRTPAVNLQAFKGLFSVHNTEN